MIEPLINCFRIPELRRKILFTLVLLAVFRIGAYIPVPGVDTRAVGDYAAQGTTGALGLVDMFAGGALSRCAVFGLGIMPYISASIVFQLLATIIKPLEELQKEGEAGQKKINQYTRYATVLLCFVQGYFLARQIEGFQVKSTFVVPPGVREGIGFEMICIASLTTGTLLLMWLGEQIQEHGIGNGISLIIMTGIVARMPPTIGRMFRTQVDPNMFNPAADKIGILGVSGLIMMYVLVVVGVVLLNQGQRRVTVQTAKQIKGRRVFGGQRYYLPLKVGAAGVIPIIFAQSLLMFPRSIFGWVAQKVPQGFLSDLCYQIGALFDMQTNSYLVAYVALIVFFCFFWTAVQFNPIKMADDMKERGNFIPGIRPGKRTAEYFERVMTRITLAGAAFISVIAILPYIIQRQINIGPAAFIYGGTGILIVVGVALDLVQKIENHLLMRHYDGFLKGGSRIKGRQG